MKNVGKRKKRSVLYIFLGVMALVFIVLGSYAYKNLYYDIRAMKRVYKAGYVEDSVELDDGLVINYSEGPDNGPNLLLIHGQTMTWEDYANVLPQLSKDYHVYAIDCYGHGDSSKSREAYSCEAMGKDINWFIEHVIRDRCVISGHSSGGILAAWVAAYNPDNIDYLVLEDPPFFSVTPEEMQGTFVWLDGFKLIHDYNEQTEIEGYTEYYMKYSYFWGLFGDLQPMVAEKASEYISAHEGEPLKLWYIPYKWIHGTRYLNEFDPVFAETFYDGTWIDGLEQEVLLSLIEVPTIYIKAKTNYGEDGVLYAANTDEDAEKLVSSIETCEMVVIESGHDIHFEKPKEFIAIFEDILNNIEIKD